MQNLCHQLSGLSLHCNFKFPVNTTSRQGVKQLGISFMVLFFFAVPMKVVGGQIHSNWENSKPPALDYRPKLSMNIDP